jgi:HEPN domain-containing protein
MKGITDDYFKDRAPEAVDRARRVCEACENLLKHLFQTKK